MAMAERWLAHHYNQPGHEIIDHRTYIMVSDGDLQEGVASEAASLAGTLRLGKLVCLYDDNEISIEGSTDISFTENVSQRFDAYGWHVIGGIDGMDTGAVDSAIRKAQVETARPSLIVCRTVIGYGSPHKAGTASAHGEPLGEEEVRLTKEQLGWPYPKPFTVPPDALAHFREAVKRGKSAQKEWEGRLEAYRRAHPEEARRMEEALRGDLPEGWNRDLSGLFGGENPPISTREASGRVMNAVGSKVHALTGGSADLAPSTKTILKDRGHYGSDDYGGHNLHFGIREHAMGSTAGGMALHGGPIPYAATFLIFYDYMRPAVRLAALMRLRVIYIFTHDSIGLGEDGPTHQPIEQIMGLRSVPNLVMLRPADATETVEAWKAAMERTEGPTALSLTRHNLPVLDRKALAPASSLHLGGYILWETGPKPGVILIATGSEVHIALEAGRLLEGRGIAARVVSMPSWELFDAQPVEYRNGVLPPAVRARVSLEAGTPLGWERYVGLDGTAMGIPHFGASAPIEVVYEKFGLSAQCMADEAARLISEMKP
jgi:transketolase